ncbi:hypothetical protein J4558_26440 [Leptolyngbya sp. 15MV]|nr:hypothetical protein J4558_26440 [Leptolyngbya sp. 15MV]
MVGILTLAEGSAGGSWLGIPLHTLAYAMFVLLIVGLLALDLGVFHRTAHEVKFREAAMWSVVWVACGLAFSGFVYVAYERHWLDLGLDTPMYNPAARTDPTAELVVSGTVGGAQALQQYLTGYVIEKSLSMDNIFVIALIFGFLGIPSKYQHRVLFWGIVGAVVMRGGMIFLGARIVADYEWVLIFFGLLLLASAAKMALLNPSASRRRSPASCNPGTPRRDRSSSTGAPRGAARREGRSGASAYRRTGTLGRSGRMEHAPSSRGARISARLIAFSPPAAVRRRWIGRATAGSSPSSHAAPPSWREGH